jgi:probable phosphoglycerate mutase
MVAAGHMGAMILLARHAETENTALILGHTDVPLTRRGRRQAEALADIAGDRAVACVYASPLGRAVETARIVAERLGVQPIVDARLAETAKGRWEGRPRAQVKAREPELYDVLRYAPQRFRFPGGESLAEHQRRVVAALRDIAGGPRPALVICHDGTIRCALALSHPQGLAAWRGFSVPPATPIPFDEGWLAGSGPA